MSSARFVKDVLAGKAILMQTIDAICTDTDTDMETVVSGSGYALTAADLQSAVIERQSGSSLDIRMFGGQYEFTEPSDMMTHQLTVNAANSKVYIDYQPMKTSVRQDGAVAWTFGGCNYVVRFDANYSVAADAELHSFSGIRVPIDGDSSGVTVAGKQVIPKDDDQSWLDSPLVTRTSIIFTISGASVACICSCCWRYLKKEQGWRLDSVRNSRTWARRQLKDAEDNFNPRLEYGSMQAAVERSIARAVNDYVAANQLDPSKLTEAHLQEVEEAACVAATNKFEKQVTAEVDGWCESRYSGLAEYSRESDAVKLIRDKTARRSFKDRVKGLDRKAGYLKAAVNSALEKNAAQIARDKSETYRDATNTAKQEAEKAKNEKVAKERDLREKEQELKDQGKTEAEIKADEDVKDLERQVRELEKKAKEEDEKADQSSKSAEEEEKKAKEHERKERDADERKKEKSGEVYGEGR